MQDIGSIKLRICHWNVLSDALCSTHEFPRSPAEVVGDNKRRYKMLVAKLEAEIELGAIVCLQEVSRQWKSKLEKLFQKHKYACQSALFGNVFDGHMVRHLAL